VSKQESLHSRFLSIARAFPIGPNLGCVSLTIFALICSDALLPLLGTGSTLVSWGCHARNILRVGSWPGARNARQPHYILPVSLREVATDA
jgi:hypothetical protein